LVSRLGVSSALRPTNHEGVLNISPNNTVGGIDCDPTDNNSPANLIAFNGDNGVLVFGVFGFSAGNRILSNSIFSNGGLGIDLTATSVFSPDGVTANDKKGKDTGANNLQNFPILTSATTTVFGTTINGTLNSRPRKTYTIQFFSSQTKDPSGFGEGETFLRSKTVTTNDKGRATFSVVNVGIDGKGSDRHSYQRLGQHLRGLAELHGTLAASGTIR
jgi:hypothetical protein